MSFFKMREPWKTYKPQLRQLRLKTNKNLKYKKFEIKKILENVLFFTKTMKKLEFLTP